MMKRTAAVLFSLIVMAAAYPAVASSATVQPSVTSVTGVQNEPVQSFDVEKLARLAEEMIRAAQIQHVGFAKTAAGDGVEITLSRKFIKKLSSPYIREIDLARKVSFEVVQQLGGTIQIRNIKGICLRAKHHIKVTELSFNLNDEGIRVASISGSRLGITRTVSAKLSARFYSFVATIAGQIKARTQEAQHALVNARQLAKPVDKIPAGADVTLSDKTPPNQGPTSTSDTLSAPSNDKPAANTAGEKRAASNSEPPTLGEVLSREQNLDSASRPAPSPSQLTPVP